MHHQYGLIRSHSLTHVILIHEPLILLIQLPHKLLKHLKVDLNPSLSYPSLILTHQHLSRALFDLEQSIAFAKDEECAHFHALGL